MNIAVSSRRRWLDIIQAWSWASTILIGHRGIFAWNPSRFSGAILNGMCSGSCPWIRDPNERVFVGYWPLLAPFDRAEQFEFIPAQVGEGYSAEKPLFSWYSNMAMTVTAQQSCSRFVHRHNWSWSFGGVETRKPAKRSCGKRWWRIRRSRHAQSLFSESNSMKTSAILNFSPSAVHSALNVLHHASHLSRRKIVLFDAFAYNCFNWYREVVVTACLLSVGRSPFVWKYQGRQLIFCPVTVSCFRKSKCALALLLT